jgi:hypothetical protein
LTQYLSLLLWLFTLKMLPLTGIEADSFGNCNPALFNCAS